MKSLDTNVLVRFIVADETTNAEKSQYAKARQELLSGQVFILDSALLETIWVLANVYRQEPRRYLVDIRAIAGFENVVLENPQRIANALAWHADGMDFADALHLAGSEQAQCAHLKTFDGAFIRRAAGRTACKVSAPA